MSSRDHDDVVRRSFGKQVGLFARPDSPFAVRAESHLEWLGALGPELLILDVACGAAHLAEAIAPHVRQVVGIDLTPALLALGAARLRDSGARNVLLQEGDAHALPFVDGSFDLVCCRTALHHMSDPQRAVSEMVRVCRPSGRVALSDLIAPSAALRPTFDRVHRLIDPSHVRTLLFDELCALLPGEVVLARRAEFSPRMALEIALTEQSDRDAVLAALEGELAGGEPTGFSPSAEGGSLTVAFPSAVVHGVRSGRCAGGPGPRAD